MVQTELSAILLTTEDFNTVPFEAYAEDFKELLALRGVPQNPAFHPEGDAYTHTLMVMNQAAGLRAKARQPLALMLAALCHDFGKAATTSEKDGRIVSYGHEKEGLSLVEAFLDRFHFDAAMKRLVLNHVRYHMQPNGLYLQHSTEKATRRLFKKSLCPEDLLLLAKADSNGRGTGNPAGDYTANEIWLRERLADFQSWCEENK